MFEGKNGHVTDEFFILPVSLPCIWSVGISGVHSCGTQERWAEDGRGVYRLGSSAYESKLGHPKIDAVCDHQQTT